jgi:biotin carboxyl carrier protein
MKLTIQLAGNDHRIEITQSEKSQLIAIDGDPLEADARQIATGIFSILIAGNSYEARVESVAEDLRITIGEKEFLARAVDPRKWKKGGSAAHARDGHQDVSAPMPGRVVRVLVKSGDAIEAGQGIAVVEAMKMQNEVRSPKSGTIERVLVKEGQTVNAGDTLAVVI